MGRGAGRIEIDALTGEAEFEGTRLPKLILAQELAAWLARDGEENGVPRGYIQRAHVTLDFIARRGADSDWVSFSRKAASIIEPVERSYSSTFDKPEDPPYKL